MTNREVLYEKVPPTKLRNRKEKFRRATNNPFWTMIADLFFYKMLENRFYSLRIKNEELFNNRNPEYPCVMYAIHGNWWDGIVGYNMMRRVFKVTPRMMIEEMNRFPVFAKAGAFPINKKSPQEAIKSLKYIVDDLAGNKKLGLWIFPQGIIKPPNFRPIEFQTGLAYIAQGVTKKSGGINLIPIAVNYVFLREDKPEVVVEVSEPILITEKDVKRDRHELTQDLQKKYTHLCNRQLHEVSTGDLEGYRYLFKQKLPWYKKIEKKLKKIEIKGSGI